VGRHFSLLLRCLDNCNSFHYPRVWAVRPPPARSHCRAGGGVRHRSVSCSGEPAEYVTGQLRQRAINAPPRTRSHALAFIRSNRPWPLFTGPYTLTAVRRLPRLSHGSAPLIASAAKVRLSSVGIPDTTSFLPGRRSPTTRLQSRWRVHRKASAMRVGRSKAASATMRSHSGILHFASDAQ
jgi:hypothetical protein